jgi:transposase
MEASGLLARKILKVVLWLWPEVQVSLVCHFHGLVHTHLTHIEMGRRCNEVFSIFDSDITRFV